MKKNQLLIAMAVTMAAIFSLAGCKKESANLPVKKPVNTGTVANPKMVLFPGAGWVPADQVHYIEPGNYLTIQKGHYLKLERASGRLMADFGEFKRQPAATPPNNNQQPVSRWTTSLNGKTPGNIPAGVGANWITWGQVAPTPSTATINSFSTTWTVPSYPSIQTDGQTIFIFSALTNSSGTDILQPVLQWGSNSSSGGGNYWSIVNVYVAQPLTIGEPGFYAYSSAVQVYPGNVLVGLMTFSNIDGDGSYVYNSSFTGYSNSLLLKENVTPRGANVFFKDSYPFAPFIPQLNTADETIEAYTGVGGPPSTVVADYPADNYVAMRSISITTASTPSTITWGLANVTNSVGWHGTQPLNANPGGEVDLWFHNAIQKPIITYPSPDVFAKNVAITPLNPTNTGGAPTGYTVSPALPATLSLDPHTGIISGTPNATSSGSYTVTATNSAGSGSFTITINVILAVNFGITNNSGNGLSITFYRVDQSQNNISTVATAHSGVNPSILVPPGIYNINWNPSGMPVNCIVTLSNGVSSPNAPGGSFTNVTIGTGSGQVTSLTAH